MTALAAVLAADGVSIWKVTLRSGAVRWQRLRKGRDPVELPAGAAAELAGPAAADALAAGAPPYLRQLWRLTEAQPGWGWTLRQVTTGRGVLVTGWCLAVEDPDGNVQEFTWVGESDGTRMRLVAQTETARAVRTQLEEEGGAPLRDAGLKKKHSRK
jgi:hypothetical protein